MGQSPGAYRGVTVVAFATSAAMWFVGYLCRLPGAAVPGWVVGTLLSGVHVAGGIAAARTSSAGWRAGGAAGFVTSLVNLLVLGSVLGDAASGGRAAAVVWIPAFLAAGALAGGAAGALATVGGRSVVAVDWNAAFAWVAAAATLLLVVVGGLVTSHEAGLAVVDWPNTFGTSMFLYPLSRMTGGIYFEHAHRLFGALVGLTTLALAYRLLRSESRRPVRGLAWVAVFAVIGQGVLGGLRVTGRFTLATDPAATAPNLTLAAVHGITGQLFFALLVALAVVTSSGWRQSPRPHQRSGAWEGPVVVAALLLQLGLGAVLRHFGKALLAHATWGGGVLGMAIFAAVRGRGAAAAPPLRRLASALLVVAPVQVALGLAAWLTTSARVPGSAPPPVVEVIAATAHQVNGALLLAIAVAFALWQRRGSRGAVG